MNVLRLMKDFFRNLSKYSGYAVYSAVASLRAEVSGSFLNWLWWILDPFLYMLVYGFVHFIVFHSKEPHFMAFVFIGYGSWTFFSRCVNQSVRLVRANKGILSHIYVPKYILMASSVFENFIRYLIAIALALIVAVFDGVLFTWKLLLFPIIVLCMVIFTFSVCTVALHIGVYFKDMSNITSVALRLMFYMSGVFYDLNTRVKKPYGTWLCRINPIALYINESRNVILNGKFPDFLFLGIWFLLSIVMLVLGVHLIHKYEQTYIKAI